MTVKFDKDLWIKHALSKRYIIANLDGTIARCKKADKKGNLLSDEYSLVTVQVHKKSGRVYFNMTWLGITKSVLVNRVIALRYLPNPDNLPQVNHIDGDKQNNALYQRDGSYQLEWSSGSDNEKHAHRTGLKTGRGSANSNAKLTAFDVVTIRASADPIKVLCERYDVSRSTITNIRTGRTWTHV